MPLSEQQIIGRIKNAAFSFLEKKLSVPKIYLDAEWPNSPWTLDVLAIDRDGIGEISVAQVYGMTSNWAQFVQNLHETPAHFKYIAVSVPTKSAAREMTLQHKLEIEDCLFAPDGIGRIAILDIDLGNGQSNLRTRPERFRIQPPISIAAETFINKHAADFELRP